MEEKLFDTLVAAICDEIYNPTALFDILLSEIYDLDEEISDDAAKALANRILDEKYVDAQDIAQRLNEEAREFVYERALAARGW